MNGQIVENIKKKFKQIQQVYKDELGHKKNNILPLIGVSKQQKQKQKQSVESEQKFSITDLIQKAK